MSQENAASPPAFANETASSRIEIEAKPFRPSRGNRVLAWRAMGEKFGIRIYDQAIAFNHILLLLKIPGRREYAAFLRAFCGLFARRIGQGLWMVLPFTRVASWGKDFQDLKKYLLMNREEVLGVRPYRERKIRAKPV